MNISKFLLKIVCMDQNELKLFLYDFLKKKYKESDVSFKEGYLYVNGTDPYTLVAHLDTVHQNKCTLNSIFSFTKEDNCCISSIHGIGGDDRCGVGIICELVNAGLRPMIIFTENEEKGCLGMQEAIKNNKLLEQVKNTNFIVQFDRKGNNDAVFYRCNNDKFKNFICENGWKEASGTYSDILILAPLTNKAAVNLSSAYYYPHTLKEYINLDEYKDVIKRSKKLLLSKEVKKSSFNYSNILKR